MPYNDESKRSRTLRGALTALVLGGLVAAPATLAVGPAGALTPVPGVDAVGVGGADGSAAAQPSALPLDLRITATKVADPRIGDDLLLDATAGGVQGVTAYLTIDGKVVGQEQSLPSRFSIPTAGLTPGAGYRVVVHATNGDRVGTASETFTVLKIAGTVQVLETSVPISAKIPVSFAADRPSGTLPVIGTGITLHSSEYREAAAGPISSSGRAELRVRRDRLYLGTHFVEVEYDGDANYAATTPTSGSWTGNVTITKIPTAVETSLSRDAVKQGEALTLTATTKQASRFVLEEMPKGALQVTARNRASNATVVIHEDLAYPGGEQPMSIPLDDFVATHTGVWDISVKNLGDYLALPSPVVVKTVAIKDATSTTASTTTVLELSRSATVILGEKVVASATVTVPGTQQKPTGSVSFRVDGAEVGRATPNAAGVATFAVTPNAVGMRRVTAHYLGNATQDPSSSPERAFQVAEALSKIVATSLEVQEGSRVPIKVEAQASTAIPSGEVTVDAGPDRLATLQLVGGKTEFVVPKLSLGDHPLTLHYAGDAGTVDSWTQITITVKPGTAPPPVDPKPVKAKASVKASFTKLTKHRVRAKVSISSTVRLSGRVEIRYGSKVVAKGTLTPGASSVRLTTKKLKKGTRKLTIRYLGSSTVNAASKSYRVKVR